MNMSREVVLTCSLWCNSPCIQCTVDDWYECNFCWSWEDVRDLKVWK